MQTDIMEIDSFLNDFTYSNEGYSSLNTPFFAQDIQDKTIDNNTTEICLKRYDEFKDRIPYEIQLFYEYVNNADIEAYSNNDITFMKWNDVLSYYDAKQQSGQSNVLDFAIKYAGMGWITVYFVNLANGKIYKRSDGGSNGYDREDNFNEICNWNGDTTKYVQCMFTHLIHAVNNLE